MRSFSRLYLPGSQTPVLCDCRRQTHLIINSREPALSLSLSPHFAATASSSRHEMCHSFFSCLFFVFPHTGKRWSTATVAARCEACGKIEEREAFFLLSLSPALSPSLDATHTQTVGQKEILPPVFLFFFTNSQSRAKVSAFSHYSFGLDTHVASASGSLCV